ncbi:MAG: YncE family protein [Peptococcaceae bacterium]|jgi:YVTN family beta-propeller protein|nr:YncE family protein [Peptococcaceae bacterium]
MLFETHAWVTLDNAVAVYDVYSETLVTTIPVGITPYFPQISPDGSRVIVPNSGSNTVSILCASSKQVLAVIPVGTAPTAVVIDSAGVTAYVVNSGSGTVSVLCIPSESVLATIPVGNCPLDAALSQDGCRLYVSNSACNTVSVIDPFTHTLLYTIPAGIAPSGLITSSDDTKLFVVNNGGNSVSVFDTTTFTLLATIPVGCSPVRIAANPCCPHDLYVTNHESNDVHVISEQRLDSIAVIPVCGGPFDLTVSPDGQQLWVVNQADHSLSIVNTASHTVQANIPAPYCPHGVIIGCAAAPSHPVCDFDDPCQVEKITESVCIIVEKVYASCQQRECFPAFSIALPENCQSSCQPAYHFARITFANGLILPDSVVVTPIPSRPNFSRVQLTLQIPYTLTLRDSCQTFTLSGNLPDIAKDIVLYFPPTRSEFDFNLRVETRSELLSNPLFSGDAVELTLGIFVVVKVTGTVQLLIPAFGFCPEPPPCEEFPSSLANPCEDFSDPARTPFPSDFFPPQLKNTACNSSCDCRH